MSGPRRLDMPVPQATGGGWPRDALVFVVQLACVLVFMHRALGHLATQFAGVNGDTAQFGWGLVNTPWALLHGHSPLLSDRVVAPSGVNLMWNTTTPLLGVVAAPLALLGGPVLAYNLTLLCVLVANCFVCYLAMSRFVRDRFTRLVASLFFGFSGYVVPQAHSHLNLLSVFLVPVLLVLLQELFVRRQWPARRVGLALGATLSAQLLISEELLATEAVAAVVGLVVLALLNPRSLMRREAAMRRFLESLLGPPDAGSGGVTIWRDQHWAAG